VTELLLQLLAFGLVWRLYPRRTYAILVGAAALNPLLYQLDAASVWLLVSCAAVNTGTAAAILRWGDVHRGYQVMILFLAVLVSFLCEVDMGGSNWVFNDYENLVRGLTVAQLLGALYGLGMAKIDRAPHQHRA
jgi:hypothetical protein